MKLLGLVVAPTVFNLGLLMFLLAQLEVRFPRFRFFSDPPIEPRRIAVSNRSRLRSIGSSESASSNYEPLQIACVIQPTRKGISDLRRFIPT
jgi:hypothetical protein